MTWVWVTLFAYVLLCCWLTYWRGPFCFAYNGLIAIGLRRLGVAGITIGARCYVADHWRLALGFCGPQTAFWRHEHYHYARQWRPLGPLMPPVYLALLAVYGYDRHPFEIPAYRAEHPAAP